MLSYVKVSQVLSILQIEFVYATVGLASLEGWTLILKVKDAMSCSAIERKVAGD